MRRSRVTIADPRPGGRVAPLGLPLRLVEGHAWPPYDPEDADRPRTILPAYLNTSPPYPRKLGKGEAIGVRKPALLGLWPQVATYAFLALFIPIALALELPPPPYTVWVLVGWTVLTIGLYILRIRSEKPKLQWLFRKSLHFWVILMLVALPLFWAAATATIDTSVKLYAFMTAPPLGLLAIYGQYLWWRYRRTVYISSAGINVYTGIFAPDAENYRQNDIATAKLVTGVLDRFLHVATVVVSFNDKTIPPLRIMTGSHRTVLTHAEKVSGASTDLQQQMVELLEDQREDRREKSRPQRDRRDPTITPTERRPLRGRAFEERFQDAMKALVEHDTWTSQNLLDVGFEPEIVQRLLDLGWVREPDALDITWPEGFHPPGHSQRQTNPSPSSPPGTPTNGRRRNAPRWR